MEPSAIGVIGIIILFVLIFLAVPIGFAMLLVGFVGIGFITTVGSGLSSLGITSYSTVADYNFFVLPLFVFMGLVASEAGLISEAYDFFYKWLGRLSGGLAIATIGACAAFASICGSSIAGAAIMSKVAFPEMRKYGYDTSLATGTIAAGGTLGILIPPSAGFILYGIITETSIGKLFIAGILPGILLALMFMIQIYITVRHNPTLGSAGPKFNWREMFISIKNTLAIIVLFVIVIGGLYIGVFTPTEAGAIGVFGAFVIALIKKRGTKKGLAKSLKETLHTTGMVFTILIGAMVFNTFMALSNLPMEMAGFVAGLPFSRYLILMIVIFIYLILGCVMDSMAMILLTMPIFFPILTTGLGFDPIWFGVTAVIMMEAGLITPPIGLNVFVVSAIIKDVPMYNIFRGTTPFVISMMICLIIITIFPQIALFLPGMMK